MSPISRSEQALRRRIAAFLGILAALFVVAVPAVAQPGPGDLPQGEFPNPDDLVNDLENPPVSVDELAPPIVDDGDRTIQIVEVDNAAYPTVDIVVAVPPAFAGDLSANAFGLTENGQVRGTDVVKLRDPIEVVVVVDTSGSMRGAPITAAKAAATQFVDALDAETRLSVVGFGADAETKSAFDDDRETTLSAIASLEAQGETALYDALTVAAGQFDDGSARRFVIVLSDGNDTVSAATLQDAAAALADDINFYAITLLSDDADFTGLQSITTQVEGQLLEATDENLDDVYGAVASRISNLYRVTYESETRGVTPVVISLDVGGDIAIAGAELELAPAGSGGVTRPTGPSARPEADGELSATTALDTGFLRSETALYIGGAAFFLAIGGMLFLVFSRQPSGPSAFERLNLSGVQKQRGGFADVADRASAVAENLLNKGQKRGALDASLEKAGLDMRPGEFVVGAFGAAVVAGVVAFVFKGPLFGLAGFGIGLVGSRLFISMKVSKRQKLFGAQLGDTLMMIAGSMRAGHGIAEAIDTVASQASAPTGEEFSRAVAEARIGRDMVESLYDIADRTESEDFIWVVRAISINRELGGDLAEILDNVGETIRDRNRLRDQVQALSAEGKVSAMILFALPVLVAVWVRISNPEYMNDMLDEGAGKIMMGAAVFSLITGGIWLKKLVNVEF